MKNERTKATVGICASCKHYRTGDKPCAVEARAMDTLLRGGRVYLCPQYHGVDGLRHVEEANRR